MAERSLDVSYETVHRWVARSGAAKPRRLRTGRPNPHNRGRLDERVVSTGRRRMPLRRTVDAKDATTPVLGNHRSGGRPDEARALSQLIES